MSSLIDHVVTGLWMWGIWWFAQRRGHKVGWIRGYFAREHERWDGEHWPNDLSREAAMRKAGMVEEDDHGD